MPSSFFFKEEDPRPGDEVEQNIIVIRPLSSEPVTHSTSLPSYHHGQANFLTSTPISPVTTTTSSLPTQSFQGTPEDFHHFSFRLSLLQVPPLFLFLVLLPILIPCLPLLFILFQTSLSPLCPTL